MPFILTDANTVVSWVGVFLPQQESKLECGGNKVWVSK